MRRGQVASWWRRIPEWLRSALVALALTAALFPEVVFAGGSLSLIEREGTIDPSRSQEAVSVRPELEDRKVGDNNRDVGSQVWQFEATTRMMSHNLRHGEDPFWNPWTASGQRGPETLVGMQLSPVVLTIAALGAGTTAFTFTLLALVASGMYCIQRFVTGILGLPRLAAVAGCLVFVLNGWATGTLGGLTTIPYLLFPLVLYADTAFHAFGGPRRFVAAVLAYGTLFASTFFPGVLLVLAVVSVVSLLVSRRSPDVGDPAPGGGTSTLSRLVPWVRALPLRLTRQAMPIGAGALLAAVVLVPVAWALLNAGPDMEAYNNRSYPPSSTIEYLSVLTPRHLYTSYLRDTWPEQVDPASWTTYLGLTPLVMVVSALRPSRGLMRRLLVAASAMVIISIGMHLGMPVFRTVWNLPVIRNVSPAYFAALAGMGMTLGVAVGVAVGLRRGWDLAAARGTSAVIGTVLSYFILTNRPSTPTYVALVSSLAFLAVAVASMTWHNRRSGIGASTAGGRASTPRVPIPATKARPAMLAVLLLVASMGLELSSYQNPGRLPRTEITDDLPDYIGFLRDNLGDQRVLNFGRAGLVPEWGGALQIRQADTGTHVQIPEYTEFFTNRIEGTEAVNRFLLLGNRPTERWKAEDRALDLAAVRYLVVDTGHVLGSTGIAEAGYPVALAADDTRVQILENTDAWPRARVTSRLLIGRQRRDIYWDPTVAYTADPRFLDSAEEGDVEVGISGYEPDSDRDPTEPGVATITHDHNTEVRIEVSSHQPSVLVLADAYHDDWTATVDGVEVDVGLVDEAFRGVVVPAGESEVVFRYRPVARDVGGIISGASLAGIAVMCLIWERRRRPGHPVASRDPGPQ